MTSKQLGDISSTVSSVTNALSTLALLLNVDQTGATLKFSQISDLISRLRLININYGQVLGKFMDGMSKAFDGQEKD